MLAMAGVALAGGVLAWLTLNDSPLGEGDGD
jgi:hypothetical protein